MKIKENEVFSQRHKDTDFYGEGTSRSQKYPVFLSNSGTLDVNDSLGPYEIVSVKRGDVRTVSQKNYRGEAYLANSNAPVKIEYFSPNKIVLNIDTNKPDFLILNQNYHNGWKIKNNVELKSAISLNGLVATPVSEEDKIIIFYYLPFSFIFGAFISISFILLISLFYKKLSKICFIRQ